MNIITQEQLRTLTGGQNISGIVLIKEYSIQLTKNGSEYVTGVLQSGTDKPFKAWSNSSAFRELKNAAYENVPAYIVGNGDDYGGQTSIVLNSVQAVDGYTPDQFFPVKYNIEAYWEALRNLVASEVTPKGLELCNKILFNNPNISDRFKVEFAARTHHDNCKGGLLAHTYKVVALVASIVKQYPTLISGAGATSEAHTPNSDFHDLLCIGALLHDIGKIYEMNFGVYQQASCVTHKYIGSEMVAEFKKDICEAYGVEWYYNLISIMLQHHGEWGEQPKTVWAQIVHYADAYEAKLMLLAQAMEGAGEDGKVKVDGVILSSW